MVIRFEWLCPRFSVPPTLFNTLPIGRCCNHFTSSAAFYGVVFRYMYYFYHYLWWPNRWIESEGQAMWWVFSSLWTRVTIEIMETAILCNPQCKSSSRKDLKWSLDILVSYHPFLVPHVPSMTWCADALINYPMDLNLEALIYWFRLKLEWETFKWVKSVKCSPSRILRLRTFATFSLPSFELARQ